MNRPQQILVGAAIAVLAATGAILFYLSRLINLHDDASVTDRILSSDVQGLPPKGSRWVTLGEIDYDVFGVFDGFRDFRCYGWNPDTPENTDRTDGISYGEINERGEITVHYRS